MQTVTPLTPEQQVQVRFDLPSPRLRIEAAGRIAWTDSWGQAGVQFVDLPERSQRLLKEWVFIQILSAAYLFGPASRQRSRAITPRAPPNCCFQLLRGRPFRLSRQWPLRFFCRVQSPDACGFTGARFQFP